ncbi:MAG TPA: CotH kinase family protein [Paludibacter sp.]|nr:CotH kinase family protein [Paludibacter sp.]
MIRFKLIFFILLISVASHSQVYINEFMASNASTVKDPDYGADADWIELYNDGTSAVNLSGYFLSDNLEIANKWMIGNITIPAKGYVIFWADGNSTGNHTSFKLDAQIEQIGLFKPDLTVVDSISYVNQQPDVSQGRNLNDLMHWGHFQQATPNTANSTEFFSDFALNEPIFNIRGGIYNSALTVTLFTDLGGEIRFTTDGSEPTLTSSIYSLPINITNTTIVRARIFKPDMLPGPVITNSYFINEPISTGGLPVVSIASEPANLWDPAKGIYVQTFKPDWEIPVNIELFENNGADRAAFNEIAGVKINGLYSWQLPQKMLGVYFKKRYGSGTLDYSIFYDTNRAGFKTFALRASGDDWSYTLMRDILGQNSTLLNMDLDISAYRWCTVYFNGQYMGIHNFREKIETDYIEKHYGLEAGTFDMVENEDFAECGDLVAYNQLKTLFSKDLSIQSNFDAVAAKMDIDNFTDLVITEVYTGNSSIDHNVMAWKPKDSGKWRWIVMDLDRGFVGASSNLINFSISQTSFPFSKLMKNAAYKSYFGKRLADHLYTSFNPKRMINLMEKHRLEIAPEMPKHIARWLGTTSSYGNAMSSVQFWEDQLAITKQFIETRPNIVFADLKNYGFTETASLNLSVYPENAGTLKLNGLKIEGSSGYGLYLKNVNSEISTEEKAGFTFKGWASSVQKVIIPKQSVWNYLDDGSNQNTAWKETAFDDTSWKSGQGELGYGDDDEKTTIGYGTSNSSKYITSYFRKSFTLTEADKNGSNYIVNLLRDDGAIVYLNGVEIIRDNMENGNIDYKTLATNAISGTDESIYYSFTLDKKLLLTGNNVIAVEIHQNAANSSDVSFDLELTCNVADINNYISTSKNYPLNMTDDLSLIAVYEQTSACVVPEVIAENTTLYKSCSPYLVGNDVTINKNVTLTIEPGVEIWMSPENNFFINGNINANGSENERVTFKINPQYSGLGWGALNFWNSTASSNLNFVTVADATRGPIPQRVGAISAFHANLNLDHLRIDNTKQNAISGRYSDISLKNSFISTTYSSDLLNIKYGKAHIANCTFIGNPSYDSDGIDYDGIENGIISNTKIYNILGDNGDAIDIGEESKQVKIDSVIIFNAFDKGISIGQRSSVVLTNSLLVNCNIGVAVKDSSSVSIDQSTFYGNGSAISCYEKNPGRAGGNASVNKSILSNAYSATYESDNQSKIKISNSLSDNNKLPDNESNILNNPLFSNPHLLDFSLSTGSPAILNQNGNFIKLGSPFSQIEMTADVMICRIFINPNNSVRPEYLALVNPTLQTLDISDYKIDEGIECNIPQGTILYPGDTIFITADAMGWDPKQKVIQWISGKLSNEGESIRVLNRYGIVVDFVNYSPDNGWPAEAFNSDSYMTLTSTNVDNHFPQNWKAMPVTTQLWNPNENEKLALYISPNPASVKILVKGNFETSTIVKLYSTAGQLMKQTTAESSGSAYFNVSDLDAGIYLVKIGTQTAKVLISK